MASCDDHGLGKFRLEEWLYNHPAFDCVTPEFPEPNFLLYIILG